MSTEAKVDTCTKCLHAQTEQEYEPCRSCIDHAIKNGARHPSINFLPWKFDAIKQTSLPPTTTHNQRAMMAASIYAGVISLEYHYGPNAEDPAKNAAKAAVRYTDLLIDALTEPKPVDVPFHLAQAMAHALEHLMYDMGTPRIGGLAEAGKALTNFKQWLDEK